MIRYRVTSGFLLALCCVSPQRLHAQSAIITEQSTLLTRPLFDPTRRNVQRDQSQHADLPVVTGVVGDPSGWTAIFAGEPHSLGGLNVRAGGVYNDWIVVSVSPREVLLARENEKLRLVPKSHYDSVHPQVQIGAE